MISLFGTFPLQFILAIYINIYVVSYSIDKTTRNLLQAMLDMSADQGWLVSTLRVIHLVQMVLQGRWVEDSTLLTLPHIQPYHLQCFR